MLLVIDTVELNKLTNGLYNIYILAMIRLKGVRFGALFTKGHKNGGRWYDDRMLSVRPAIAVHKRNRTYDRRKFERKFTTYLQLSYTYSVS